MKNLAPLAVVLLAGCATPGPTPEQIAALELNKQRTMQALVDCAMANVSDFDDGISSALIIGGALAGRCSKEFDDHMEAKLDTASNDAVRRALYLRWTSPERRAEILAPVVLKYRAAILKSPTLEQSGRKGG